MKPYHFFLFIFLINVVDADAQAYSEISNVPIAQIKIPPKFYYVRNSVTSGDSYYTDGHYSFTKDNPFQAEEPKSRANDESIIETLKFHYGFNFNKVDKNIFVGSGYNKDDKEFRYVVCANFTPFFVRQSGKKIKVQWIDSFSLVSKKSNKGFSNYSNWLLNQIRIGVNNGCHEIEFK